MEKKPVRIGLIGYGFMGRTHSNAYSQLDHFFDTTHVPVRQAVCGRDEGNVKAFVGIRFANQWWVVDPQGALLNLLAFSNGGEGTVGG